EKLSKAWNRPIYGFFEAMPEVQRHGGHKCHVFRCAAKYCKGKTRDVRRFLHTSDKNSTGNLRKHARKCWGDEVLAGADEASNASEIREGIVSRKIRSGNISLAFERKGKGVVTYSTRPHDRTEARCLMNTGRPGIYIPSPSTISRDVKAVFKKTSERVASMLQDHEGKISLATDCWTSPNHRAFLAATVHLEEGGNAKKFLLDFVEVA
ncbi:hypothetical protein FPV67DRAFT_1392093, partial [Lyophyllum atratum]